MQGPAINRESVFEAIDCHLISLFVRIPINDRLKISLLGRHLFVNFDDFLPKRNNQVMNCTTLISLGALIPKKYNYIKQVFMPFEKFH